MDFEKSKNENGEIVLVVKNDTEQLRKSIRSIIKQEGYSAQSGC